MKKIQYPAWADALFVFIILTVFYLLTVSQRLTWANFGNDGGDFFSALLTNGIPHPTGYPTYLLLGWLLQQLPLGDAYFRAVLLSWLPAAAACALLCAWVNSLRPRLHLPGIIAGLIWGLSPLFWSQAVIIEVYALQALFSVLALWWITLLFREKTPGRRAPLFALAFIFGLGIGNHLTQVLLGPACLVGLFVFGRQTKNYRWVAYQVILVVLGGLVYVVLPLRAALYPPINWGNPQTLSGFLWEVSGAPYQSLLGAISPTTLVGRLVASAGILRDQVGVIGIVLGVIGGYEFFQTDRKLRWISLWIFCVYLAFAIGYNTADSTAYLMPAWMIFSAWAGISLIALDPVRWKSWRLVPVLFIGTILSLGFRVPNIIAQIAPEDRYQAADIAEQTLQALPENAIVFTSSDLDTFPLWAYHFGLGQRKDLAVIVLPLTQFRWYQETLVHTLPQLNFPPLSPADLQTTQWGEQAGLLNPGRIICRSTIQQCPKVKMNYACSNGVNFMTGQ